MKIQLGEWLPDLGDTNNPGALIAHNVIPSADGYRPFPSLQTISTGALNAYARGAISIKSSGGTSYVYAGSASKLYVLSTAAWTDVTRSSGGNYATATEDAWEFVQWGEMVIATNYTDDVQQITLGGANFAALSGSPPKARHIAVVRDFVVLANINDGTERTRTIRWSGFGDETKWTTNPANQSDAQELPGGGRIVRVIGGERGVIFSEYGITEMVYEGPPTVFRFNAISTEKGALSPGSVIDAGDGAIFFIGLDDFYVMSGNQIQSIGANKVARTFFEDLAPNYTYRINGAIDKRRSLVVWAYPGQQSASGQPNKVIFYHWPTGKWATADAEVNALYSFLSPGYTLDTLDTLSSSLDALDASLDSPAYQGGALSLGAFNGTHYGVTFTGEPLTARIDTTEVQIEDSLIQISEAFPVIQGGTTTIEHGHRYLPASSVTWETAVSQNSAGGYPLRKINRFHRLRLNISGQWTKAKEVQANVIPAGKR